MRALPALILSLCLTVSAQAALAAAPSRQDLATLEARAKAKEKVVACPTAVLAKAIPTNVPGWQGYGGYGHNYAYLGYTPDDRKKLSIVTKPVETCLNGDGLDPAPSIQWWMLGYLYPPTVSVQFKYVRHGTGGNYSWVDGHVSMTSWKTMSTGQAGKVDWYYQPSP